ncbi:VOC family protein [Sphingobium aquiterrae]|uniref:VOC family protein n=1 Tax=Sphingobium aquiterrae TaxID=2038656 RepID=UPI0030190916
MAARLNAILDHIAIESDNPGALSTFYAAALRRNVARIGKFDCVERDGRTLLFKSGTKKHIAFSSYSFAAEGDFSALETRLKQANAPIEAAQSPIWQGKALRTRDPDGNAIEFGLNAGSRAPNLDGPHARLQHVVFATRNVEPVERFYRDICGFGLSDHVLDDEGGVRATFMHSDAEHHALAVFQAAENRLDHHCYEARDWNELRDWADHFAGLGLKLQWGPGRHGPGNNLFLFINDPDGNWIEISAELELLEEGRTPGEWKHEERTLNLWGHGKLRS